MKKSFLIGFFLEVGSSAIFCLGDPVYATQSEFGFVGFVGFIGLQNRFQNNPTNQSINLTNPNSDGGDQTINP